MSPELDQKIQDVQKHVQTERKILEAYQVLSQATSNQDVLRKTNAKIRETEQSLLYFEQTLCELQSRKQQPIQHDDSGQSQPPSSDVAPKARPFTNLDLIKSETPLTPAKISKMLHQLEFKLQVEIQYKQGIDKMTKLYQAGHDKKSRVDADRRKFESEKKVHLLQTALKRYKNLHILDEMLEEDEAEAAIVSGESKDNLRSKPLSGTLWVTIKGARDLDHAPLVSRNSRSAAKLGPNTLVGIKVGGTQLAKSHSSRTDKWNQQFEITVDKASEVELALYDRQPGDVPAIPIGLLWIRISDLVEALRRQKVEAEAGNSDWVTAGAMPGNNSTSPAKPMASPGMDSSPSLGKVPKVRGAPGMNGKGGQGQGIDAWFAVEPAGALNLHLNFVKDNVRKRPLNAPWGGLGRQGAVRKREGQVHEQNGHKFVQRQFYQIMLCAFCGDFLLNPLGYQCEDCRFTCHKKCYKKVVTKCISKSNALEGEAEKINHQIPHRFEPFTNIGASWCCHCGYILRLSRKQGRKCSECDITCHASCAHLVPDFCGMSMELTEQLVREGKDIARAREEKRQQQGPQQQGSDMDTTHGDPHQHQQSRGSPTPGDVQLNERVEETGTPKISPSPYPSEVQLERLSPGAMTSTPPSGQGSHGNSPMPYQGIQPSSEHLPIGSDPQGSIPQSPRESIPQSPREFIPQSPRGSIPQSPRELPVIPPLQPRVKSPAVTPPAPIQTKTRRVTLDDFYFIAVLGRGNFGKVMLAEEKKTKELYAIKVMKKHSIVESASVDSTHSEARVFQAVTRERHPFLLALHSCFQTELRVYFVMEFVGGGDLVLHIQRQPFTIRQAKFYASEVLLALEYLHENGIIYRDLKLENILLAPDGHIKIADYGLCKSDMWHGSTTRTFCGTPELMAPEIILNHPYGRAVDWWAFGVLTYQMLLSQSPFRGDDDDEVAEAILEDEPLYPITMPQDAISFIQKLLNRDPQRRLGCGKEGAAEIKRQPFFRNVNWDDVLKKRVPPPYLPRIEGTTDTSNFDKEFTLEKPGLTPVPGTLSSQDQAGFGGFSWVASWADV